MFVFRLILACLHAIGFLPVLGAANERHWRSVEPKARQARLSSDLGRSSA
jgi:hypothetical protein